LVYDIIDVVPQPDNPQTNHKLKLLFAKEMKGPVAAVCGVDGYLAASFGSKVVVHSFDNNETLKGIAFLDGQIFCHALQSIKHLLLVSDVYKSVWLAGFQQEPAKVEILGKDYRDLDVYATEFLIDESLLHFVVSDSEKNIQLLSYSPNNLNSFAGQRLLRRAEIHVGSNVLKFGRLLKRASPQSRHISPELTKQHMCLFGTQDGALGFVIPLNEQHYKRLLFLYNKLFLHLPKHAGLNAKAFR
jgi:cleavage and polyadenylation specificity factor subunit 1